MLISQETRVEVATINGAPLYFEVKGKGSAPLLVHTGVADNRMWDRQFTEFSKNHIVIRPDLLGFGRSGMVPGVYAHHGDMAALLNYLNIERTEVIGASFGGSVALDFVMAYPDRISALVLADPSLGAMNSNPQLC